MLVLQVFFALFWGGCSSSVWVGFQEGLGCPFLDVHCLFFLYCFPNIIWQHINPTLDHILTQVFGHFLVMSVGLYSSEATICVVFQQKCMLKPTPEILGKHFFEHSCTNDKTCFGVFLFSFGLGSFCHVRLFVELCLAREEQSPQNIHTNQIKRWTIKSKTRSK